MLIQKVAYQSRMQVQMFIEVAIASLLPTTSRPPPQVLIIITGNLQAGGAAQGRQGGT